MNLIRVMPAKGQDAMQTSLYLAKLIGPVLVVMGLALVTDPRGNRTMAQDFLASRALIFLAGLLALVPGLAIVLSHNVWAADWRVIITLLGWLSVAGGAIRLLFPRQLPGVARPILEHREVLRIAGAAMILLGLVLGYFGYIR